MGDNEYHGPRGVEEFVGNLLEAEVELIIFEVMNPHIVDSEYHDLMNAIGLGMSTLRHPSNLHLVKQAPLALAYLAFHADAGFSETEGS